MLNQTSIAEQLYEVVVNGEEQYSILLADKTMPAGWNSIGVGGRKEACLAHINNLWCDMRPLSLRKQIEKESL